MADKKKEKNKGGISDEERDRRLNLIQEMKLSRKKQYE